MLRPYVFEYESIEPTVSGSLCRPAAGRIGWPRFYHAKQHRNIQVNNDLAVAGNAALLEPGHILLDIASIFDQPFGGEA